MVIRFPSLGATPAEAPLGLISRDIGSSMLEGSHVTGGTFQASPNSMRPYGRYAGWFTHDIWGNPIFFLQLSIF